MCGVNVLLLWGLIVVNGRNYDTPTPAAMRGRASGSVRRAAIVIIVAALSACGASRHADEQRVRSAWGGVQEAFDRLERCELDFRMAAAAMTDKADDEKLRCAHDFLDQRAKLQAHLKDEMGGAKAAMRSESQSARVLYITKLRQSMARLEAVQRESQPAASALRLEKFDKDLRAYRALADKKARVYH